MKPVVFDSNTRKCAPHLALWILRFIYAGLIVFALPESHLRWCESLQRGDIEGQKAMGFIVIFFMIGAMAASFYLLMTSIVHYLLKKSPRAVAAADGLLFLMLGGLLVYMGVHAEYR